MLEDKLKNVCDRFYVDAENLENYGKNTAAEEFDGADSFVGTGKILRLSKIAFEDIISAARRNRGLGRLFQDEMYLIEDAFSSCLSLKGRSFRGKRGSYPFVLGLAMNLVRCGNDLCDKNGISLFITGVEKNNILSFSETECFHLFARLSLLLYFGELAKRDKELSDLKLAEEKIKKDFDEGCAPSFYERKKVNASRELSRGIEEQARIYLGTLRRFKDPNIIKTPVLISKQEKLLQADPSGVYFKSTERTKGYLRFLVSYEAKLTRRSEVEIISSALESADTVKGITEKICNLPFTYKRRKVVGFIHLALENLLPIFFGVLTGLLGNIFSALFSALLWRELFSAVLNYVSPRFVLPRELCALEFENGIPDEYSAVCVISLLTPNTETVTEHMNKLEKYYLTNRDCKDGICFGLLMDLKDSKQQSEPDDCDILRCAEDHASRLNEKYGRKFFAVTRNRVKCDSEGMYIPWERKRGAITELSAMLEGLENSCVILGLTLKELQGRKYIITLDADTEPYPQSLAKLVGTAAHPVNKAEISACGKVVSGYGIIKPRIGIELESANTSLFSRIFSGLGGTSHYSSSLSDVEWCIFGISNFTGKGIIDVKAMNSVLRNSLPEERILSHDILEGGMIRCGYCHQTEFSDGFPSSVRGYYKRLGRWTRGDIQLLPWVFSTVKNRSGEKISNPISPLTAYDIARNAFRALFSISALLSVILFVAGFEGWGIAAGVALLDFSLPFVFSLVQRLFTKGTVPVRKYSDVYAGVRGGIILAVSKFVFLPYEAWVTLRSCFTALWRMLVTKKKLLEWVTAAEGDRLSSKGPLKTYCSMISSVFIAALTVVIGLNTGAFFVAVIWMLAPLFASYLSVKIVKIRSISDSHSSMLKAHAEKIEAYFSDIFRTSYFLPCDNYQVMPYIGWADRTSPTNIGMCLLAAVSSWKLGFISKEEALLRCEKLCSAIEGLEKYRGNLYNWYGCSDPKPLEPRFISSVDSGNLVAAMATVSAELSAWDEQAAWSISERLDLLWRNTDLSVFYSEEQKLLAIGLDKDKKRLGGFYDMLAGECRLTYYVAAAKGDIPVEAWQNLSRSMTTSCGWAGLASWSGSLFEYLMPEILMPVIENSLLYESGEFAVGVQKRKGDNVGLPWGVSECCYPEFDPMMNYQYKAHGNQTLALGRLDPREYTVSPYSSYLALGRGVKRVCKNLERLTELGAMGRYGLCESVDFTGSRLPDDCNSLPVKTYMTHHLGMSLCSIANVLCDDFLILRFMSVSEFSAMAQLLSEQIPSSPINKMVCRYSHRPAEQNRVKESFPKVEFSAWSENGVPCGIVSNGELTVIANATGNSFAVKGDLILYRRKIGIITAVKIQDKSLFLKGKSKEDGVTRCFAVKKDSLEYGLICEGLSVRESVCAVKGSSAEKRIISFKSDAAREIEFALYFEPQLCSSEKYNSHPEFERLKLEAKTEDNKIITLKRRDSAKGDIILKVICNVKADKVCLSRSNAIGRGGEDLPNIFFENDCMVQFSDGDPCVLLGFKLSLEAGKEKSIEFLMSVIKCGETTAVKTDYDVKSARGASDFSRLCMKEKLDSFGIKDCFEIASLVCGFSDPVVSENRSFCRGKNGLWNLKISGDLQIIVLSSEDFTSEGNFLNAVFRVLKAHKVLRRVGISFDLAVLCDDGGNYDRPVFNGIGEAVRFANCADALNQRGGIHVIDKGSAEKTSIEALYSFGIFYPIRISSDKNRFELCLPKRHIRGNLPPRIHSVPLANQYFGMIAADVGPVLIYALNSRLLKLIAWQNDPLASSCDGMKLYVKHNGMEYSLFCENDEEPSSVEYFPGKVVWKRRLGAVDYRVTAFADSRLPSVTFHIEAEGEQIPTIYWKMKPSICEHITDNAFVSCGGEDNVFSAFNPTDQTGTMFYAVWSAEPKARLQNSWEGCFEFLDGELTLCLSTSESAANIGANFANEAKALAIKAFSFDNVKINTGNGRIDGYINTWSEYQIRVSRLWSKSSAFQNGGAVGFRDQLQDAASLLLTSPNVLREQILKCCSHQYEEGDVMHWFHEGAEVFRCGVRTRCSDDLLWLVREVCEYVFSSGELDILDIPVCYLKSEPLRSDEDDRYEKVVFSQLKESVFDHCVRSVEQFISRGTDENGLPRILGGDWNDGFSKLGIKGRGVSVWLGFFASEILSYFARLCELTGKTELSGRYAEYAETLLAGASNAWDGDRFIRAITDDGVVLGSKASSVFGIDSISESFSWFVKSENSEFLQKREIALNTALKLLKEDNSGVWKLFDRAVTDRRLGYIADYPLGVRENGGQYTHAAVWLAIACFKANRPDDGFGILCDIINAAHSDSYGGESFVIAADVSDKGKCGWSWYTGSAGWYRRAVLEYLLGIRLEMGKLIVSPNLPKFMNGYSCDIKINGTLCKIRVTKTGERKDFKGRIENCENMNIEVTV